MDSRDVETYYDDGVWKNRRSDCARPFSRGPRRRQIAIGAEVARWAHANHIIRNIDGTIEEINCYGHGPYPPRSPTRTIRPSTSSSGTLPTQGPRP